MTDLTSWRGRPPPDLEPLEGRYVRIEPFTSETDARVLFDAIGGESNKDLWRYIPIDPPENATALADVFGSLQAQQGWKTYVLCDLHNSKARGIASYMRIRPEAGSAEIGCIVFSKALQRTRAASEAMYLMAQHVFDYLGYRRYEWKCNNENEASKRAALRLGFTFEGIFRNDQVVKGRNRDTAWYSITDDEWPNRKSAFGRWLSPENFDADGVQIRSLSDLRGD